MTKIPLIVFYFSILSTFPLHAADMGVAAPRPNPVTAVSASQGIVTSGTIDTIEPDKIVIRDENREMDERYVLTDRTQFFRDKGRRSRLGTEVTIQSDPGTGVVNVIALKPTQ